MIAFRVETRGQVDGFYKVGLKSGDVYKGRPGLRPEDGDEYYAHIRDPAGTNYVLFAVVS